jgi:two-component system response regulator AtoC
MARAILIVEDETVLAKNMQTYLLREGFDVEVAATGEEALACVETFHPDVILLDYSLPNMNGLEVLNRLRQSECHAKVIMVTGQGSVESAVEAMKLGAYDYLTKPVALSELKLVIDRAAGTERLASALHYYHDKEARESGLAKLTGNSPPMMALKDTIRRLLDAEKRLLEGEPPAVLITGDTGTGKELVARALHFDGTRHDKPFIELNCASIPGALLEAELFGYEKGAFTDAKERKMGLVEAADGGTLFLDEIGEVEPSVQVKLLKLLEEKTVRRVGGLREQKVNIRVIAATNRNLEKMVHEGKFRSDLFFRLRIVYISLPPLRARQNDVLLLARRFLTQHGARYGKPMLRFTELAEKRLLEYSWPGNVRELRNAIEQAVLVAQGDVVEAESFAFCHTLDRSAASAKPAEARSSATEPPHAAVPDTMNLEEVERHMLSHALVKTAGNVTRAAKLLGLTRDMLRYRMEKYGILAPH